MAPSSSSTKKAAKLAQTGKGKKIRFQGGTLFPLIVTIVLVLGLALVVYARESRPSADASQPQVGDHWHVAYGFYLCDQWVQLQGDAEERDANGAFLNVDFARTGVHSHDDGLIHWHANSRAAVGRRATFKVFLDVYDIELGADKLVFPEAQRSILPAGAPEDGVYEEGETKCNIDGEEVDGSIQAVVWDNFTDTDDGTTFIAAFENIRVDKNSKVISVAFVPDDTQVPMPPWAQQLPELGAIDGGQQLPDGSLFSDSEIPEGEVPTITAGAPGDAPEEGDEPATTDAPSDDTTDTVPSESDE